jgi:putative aldouronate transport system permease protein
MRNTVVISTLRLVCGMPVPIIFALLLNEVRVSWYKRVIQTVTYFPNFLSWVIYAGIMMTLLAPSGVVNHLSKLIGLSPPNFLVSNATFVSVLVVTDILKSFGFGAIVYLAALSGVDEQLYEAAAIDGAGKWRQIWHITLPGIRPIIVVMFVLALGGILNAGFDQIFNMYNASVMESSDILDTYVYRIGFSGQQYSVGTAIGLFKGVIGFALIIAANTIIRRLGEASIW